MPEMIPMRKYNLQIMLKEMGIIFYYFYLSRRRCPISFSMVEASTSSLDFMF
jgi:hypothetical protein